MSTELGKLMHDFLCTNPDEMHYKELAKKARYYKEDEKGVSMMCKAMEAIEIPKSQWNTYIGLLEK